jgi:hypothetical protein
MAFRPVSLVWLVMIKGMIPLLVFWIGFPGTYGKINAPAPAPMDLKKKLRRDIDLFIVRDDFFVVKLNNNKYKYPDQDLLNFLRFVVRD